MSQVFWGFAGKLLCVVALLGMTAPEGVSATQKQGLPRLSAVGSTVVLGGVESGLELEIRGGESGFDDVLQYRLFQRSHRLFVGVGEGVKWKKVAVGRNESQRHFLSLQIPTVRATTRFKLVFFDDKAKRLSDVDFTVHPKTLLDSFKSLIHQDKVGIWDAAGSLRSAWSEAEIKPRNLESRWNAEDFTGELLIVTHGKRDQVNLDEKKSGFRRVTQRGANVLLLLSDPAGTSPLPMIIAGSRGTGNLVVADLEAVADISRAEQQFRLAELVKFCRSRRPLDLLDQFEVKQP